MADEEDTPPQEIAEEVQEEIPQEEPVVEESAPVEAAPEPEPEAPVQEEVSAPVEEETVIASPEPAVPEPVVDISPTETPAAADPQEYAPVVQQLPKQAPIMQQCVIQESPVMQEPLWPPKPRSPKPPVILGPKTVEITLNKEEGQSWGFRLGGGREFATPLSVNRIQFGGLAEQQGFQVGDIVEQINGMPTADMNHNEALETIKKAGNKCLFTITRNITAGKVIRPFKTMAPLDDLTVAQPLLGAKPALDGPVAAHAAMRNVSLGQLTTEEAELHFTEEVIKETMTSHAEIVVGNAIGVNFHKFEPKYDHLALSGVYKMLLEEEARRGKAMTLPRPLRPQAVAKKQPPKEPTPPPKEPTPPPREPTPPPKSPTPPPREPTPPPKSPTPPPREPTPPPTPEPEEEVQEPDIEPELIPEPEPEFLEAEEPLEEEPLTNGVNGIDEELEAIEAAVIKKKEPEVPTYFQRQHKENQERLNQQQQLLLQKQIQHKMNLEECRRRINKAQKTIYAPTITAEEQVVVDCSTGLERKLPKAGSRYRPCHPLTPAASLHQAFSTQAEVFKPFEARAPPVFQPTAGMKPLAKPASAVQCVIPMQWHPPSQLINGQPYKYQPTVHKPSNPLPEQQFLPPPQPKPPKPEPSVIKEAPRPVAHPLQPVAQVQKHDVPGEQLTEDDIAEMMSANAEVIVGQTLGVNFQKFMPGFDHLQNSAVYRMVHGLEE